MHCWTLASFSASGSYCSSLSRISMALLIPGMEAYGRRSMSSISPTYLGPCACRKPMSGHGLVFFFFARHLAQTAFLSYTLRMMSMADGTVFFVTAAISKSVW